MNDASASTRTSRLTALLQALRQGRGFAHKRDIAQVLARLPESLAPAWTGRGPNDASTSVPNGDDCAALPQADGSHLLLAIEGLMPDFVQQQPWFAGYSAVLVNLSDVAAMGGRALAVVDALWSAEPATAEALLDGMRAACQRYGVPLLGGHSNLRAPSAQLAVAVLGRAQRLISSFAARPGDRLLMAVDLRGHWMGDQPFWNASTEAPPARLQADLALLAELAEAGLCRAGKDISMAGVLGTLLMLLECSGQGAQLQLDALPHPPAEAGWPGWSATGPEAQAAQLRWLSAFPSHGFVLAVAPEHAAAVIGRFQARALACADFGQVRAGTAVDITLGTGARAEHARLWDFASEGFLQPSPRAAGPEGAP